MKVYLLWDNYNVELVDVYANERSARQGLMDFLESKTSMCFDEWDEIADKNGYDSVEEFKRNVLRYPDYDDDLEMLVEERTVLE